MGTIFSKVGSARLVVQRELIHRGLYSKNSQKRLVIVMYHGIDKVQNTHYNERFFSRNNFEKHLVSFRQHFHVLNHDDLVNGRLSDKRPNIVLTFDDGYANNYHYALPLLDKYGVHAYFFITGLANQHPAVLWADGVDIVSKNGKEGSKVSIGGIDFILSGGEFISRTHPFSLPAFIRQSNSNGYAEKQHLLEQLLAVYDFRKNRELDDYWQLMTDEEIYKASRSRYITIGSHGFYHNNLGSLSLEDALAEVAMSKNYLEHITQKPVTSIGFPDGSYTEALNDGLHNMGIDAQFVVDYRYNDSGRRTFIYDRMGLYPSMGNTHKMVYKILHQ